MITKTIIDEYLLVTKILFEKNFLNMGLGSISLKLKADKMLINKKNRHILEDDFFKSVHILRKDMSWQETTPDVTIHSKIYELISSTKAIANIFPVNTMTFIQTNHNYLNPIDFLGKTVLDKIPVIEITNEKNWTENRDFIIAKKLQIKDIVIVKGYGVFIKSRDIREIIQKAVILENSAKILINSKH